MPPPSAASRPVVVWRSVGIGAAGAVRMAPVTFAPASVRLTAPSMGVSLKTSPLAVSRPVTDAAGAAAPAAEAAAAPRAVASAPLTPAGRALAAPADAPGKTTVIAGVETAFTRLQGAKENGPAAPAAVLDQLFEGFERKDAANDAPAPVGRGTEGRGARLAPATVRAAAPANGPRWVLTEEKPAAPKTNWKRTLSVGFLAASVPLFITAVITGVAQALGYAFNSNYNSPAASFGEVPGLLEAGVLVVAAAVMAPVAEEIIFRAGLQGGLAKVTKFMRLGSFVVSATLVSLLFVAIHETSDPVLFATRFIHSLILAWAFKKEGLLASMAAHGFFNGLLTLPILAGALVGLLPASPLVMTAIASAAVVFAVTAMTQAARYMWRKWSPFFSVPLIGLGALATLVASLLALVSEPVMQFDLSVALLGVTGIAYVSAKAFGYLRAQRADRESGAVAPKPFTVAHGWLALFVMAAGYFLLVPNVFWLAGMIIIVPWLAYKHLKG